jgi:hypothetical protein
LSGLLAQRQGDTHTAEERLSAASRDLREAEASFVLAQVLLEHAELLHGAGREDESAPLQQEATEIFTRLRAAPWLARAQSLGAHVPA